MRDPNRLHRHYQQQKRIHMEKVPDWRIGQLYSNYFSWLLTEKGLDPFYIEDSRFVELFNEYLGGNEK